VRAPLAIAYILKCIEEAYVKCYKEMHPALQFGQDVQLDLQAYAVKQKYRSIDKYIRWIHDPSFTMLNE
jgi:hypothetical protein